MVSRILKKGFTLIEILIVIGIIGLLLLGAVPIFSTYDKKLAIKSGAMLVRSAIWEAQALAMGPHLKDIEYYWLEFQSGSSEFDLGFKEEEKGEAKFKTFILPQKPVPVVKIEKIYLDSGQINKIKVKFFITEKGGKTKFETDSEEQSEKDLKIQLKRSNYFYCINLNRITGQVLIKRGKC